MERVVAKRWKGRFRLCVKSKADLKLYLCMGKSLVECKPQGDVISFNFELFDFVCLPCNETGAWPADFTKEEAS